MNREHLNEWSERMLGARMMMKAIIKQSHKFLLDDCGKDSKVYHDAIVRLVLSNLGNTQNFLMGRQIAYTNHQRDKKGKLILVEAYFL